MTSTPVNRLNEQIENKTSFIKFLNSEDVQEKFSDLSVDWATGNYNPDCDAATVFQQEGYIDLENSSLTRMGILFLSRICIDFSTLFSNETEVSGKYIVKSPISIGKNSATFCAEHKTLSSKVVLKFIRPGASKNIEQALQVISREITSEQIVQPLDFFEVGISDVFNNQLEVKCVVFPYVEGDSLKDFLYNHGQSINPHTLVTFIKQVGTALYDLEKNGAYHGDLHEENIIVTTVGDKRLSFKIIDVSFGSMGSLNEEVCHESDLTYFRKHLWKILSVQQSYLPKMSIRKCLGSKVYSIVSSVLSNDISNFSGMVSHLNNNEIYLKFTESKKAFLDSKFKTPSLFKLQRYEEFTDPTVALKLFVPFPELMSNVKEFANVFIEGNRGSGKSTYLAALAFFPRANFSVVDFREIFGVYFPCRLGEFRLMSAEMYDGGEVNYGRLKQVIIIKIIRRTLEIISDAIEFGRISEPVDYKPISIFLKNMPFGLDFYPLDPSVVSEMKNYASSLVRVEMKEIESLYNSSVDSACMYLREVDLYGFLKSIRETFSELSHTQFHLLFDDAGQPHVPEEVQKVLNDLMLSSNPLYCLKFSAEKLTYTFVSTQGTSVENGHDYYEYDISLILFIGSYATGLNRNDLEKYFRKIIETRLDQFEYQSNDIVDYLGNDQIKHEQLINSLATGKRNAYYCGWSMVWNIADRTPRNLLEIIAEIFSSADIDKNTIPSVIHNRVQDRAIRIISEKRLQSLNHISGVVNIKGQKSSLGRKLFEITTTLGSAYRIYLKEERGKERKRQTLAIERNETVDLLSEADLILRKLITYGVLDSAKLDFARDDRVKKPIYVLNRIFCPAFGITPQRDNHLRLSKLRFEQLLLEPGRFLSEGTKKLRSADDSEPVMGDLFGGIDEY